MKLSPGLGWLLPIAFCMTFLAFLAFGDRWNEPQSGLLPSGGESGETSEPPPSPLSPEIKVIALDAGHGGEDTGGTYPVDASEEEGLLFE